MGRGKYPITLALSSHPDSMNRGKITKKHLSQGHRPTEMMKLNHTTIEPFLLSPPFTTTSTGLLYNYREL